MAMRAKKKATPTAKPAAKRAVAKKTAPKRAAKKAAAKRAVKKETISGEKTLRRWFQTVWNEGRLEEGFASLAHPDIVFHSVAMAGGPLIGLEGFRELHTAINNAFSGLRFTIDDVLEAGDKAAVRWSATLDHTKDGLGPATGKTVTLSGMAFIRMKDGKVVETWDEWSRMGFLKQLNLAIP